MRFAQCESPGIASTCQFSIVREGNAQPFQSFYMRINGKPGLIVALLSIGTLVGALLGAP